MENSELDSRGNEGVVKRASTSDLSRSSQDIDDATRPVWLEATESFYKKLNRIAKECQLSRYEALSKGLDALFRETQVRRSALNRNIKSPGQSEVFRRTMDWSPFLRQAVKTHFSVNGELSHGVVTQAVHTRI